MSLKSTIAFAHRCVFPVCLLGACATVGTDKSGHESRPTTKSLIDVSTVIQDDWRHLPIRGRTEYRVVAGDGDVVIRAEGKKSASGLIRSIEIDSKVCPNLEWRWRVDELQSSAYLKEKEREDVAASLFLLFGDPGFMSNPEPVPTLRYVWTNNRHTRDEVIDNPYLPGVVRSIVVRAGEMGAWFTETRNIGRDYQLAFGGTPKEAVHAIALFTDNDQTKEPTVAYYSWARIHCRAQKASDFSYAIDKDAR